LGITGRVLVKFGGSDFASYVRRGRLRVAVRIRLDRSVRLEI
jgi:hypothetical protein